MFFDDYTGSVLSIAHRGARSLAPENTLAAAEKALDTGAYAWEVDVQVSRDGHLVLTHDATLERVTDVANHAKFASRAPWRVADFTLNELKELSFGAFFVEEDPFEQIAQGAVSYKEAEGLRNISLPTLEEGLRFTREKGFRINIEIKELSGTPGHKVVVKKVVEMVRQFELVEQTLISSFHCNYLRQAHKLLPELPLAVLMEAKDMETNDMETNDRGQRDIRSLLAELNATAWHPDKAILTAHDLAAVLETGVLVNVYTVNDEEEMRFWAEQGVSGLITDFPQRVGSLGLSI